jgi:AbrB family looped-hinge helix DNA binding protein
MKKYEITSLSSKGQIVIPTQIRKRLALAVGTKMAIMTDGKNVLLQKIESPRISKFNDLIARSQEIRKRKKLKKSDIPVAIKTARKKKGCE